MCREGPVALPDELGPLIGEGRQQWPDLLEGGVGFAMMNPLSAAQLWGIFVGTTLAGIGFMGAGMAEGSFRAQGAAPDAVAAGLVGYHFVVTMGLGLAAVGGIAALLNVFLAYTSGEPVQRAATTPVTATAAGH